MVLLQRCNHSRKPQESLITHHLDLAEFFRVVRRIPIVVLVADVIGIALVAGAIITDEDSVGHK